MLKLSTNILQSGLVLSKPIIDDRGHTLLRAGMTLTDEYISVLRQRSIKNAFVDIPDGIVDDEMLTTESHKLAQKALAQLFNLVQQTAQYFSRAENKPAQAMAKDRSAKDSLQSSEEFRHLNSAVVALLDDVLRRKTLEGLGQIKAKSQNQFRHAVDVTTVALALGKRLYLSKEDLIRLGVGCLLHDIGKIFFVPCFFQANGKTPLASRRLKLQDHTWLGYELLRSRNPTEVVQNHIALQHHERQDGRGYPRGLQGTNAIKRARFEQDTILLAAEIAAVADSYDILTTQTSEKPALSPEQVVNTMHQLAGTYLNKELVEIFVTMLPTLPTGINVVVKTSRYANYKGIVLHENSKSPNRPTIRLTTNPSGDRISAIDINLASKENIVVEAIL